MAVLLPHRCLVEEGDTMQISIVVTGNCHMYTYATAGWEVLERMLVSHGG
jgi:hypothetical protein